jgi:hypothetical protein
MKESKMFKQSEPRLIGLVINVGSEGSAGTAVVNLGFYVGLPLRAITTKR